MKKTLIPKQYDKDGNLIVDKDYGYHNYIYEYKNYILLPQPRMVGLNPFYIIIDPKGFTLNPLNDLSTCNADYRQSWIDFLDNRYVLKNLKKCKEFINAHIEHGDI